MLPHIYYQRYQEFLLMLAHLQQAAAVAVPDAQGLLISFLNTQQFFVQQILSLDNSDLEPDVEPTVRSYQTEIAKQLQLLRIDVTFLQAARQPQTATVRQNQIHLRLQTLIDYCNATLKEAGETKGA